MAAAGNRIVENASFLHFLCKCATPAQQKQILKLATPDQINAICECAFNILRQNLTLPDPYIAQLRKPQNKKLIYHLASRKNSIAKKKKIINQKGGFPFLALLAPLVGSVIGALISNK
jgi:hypothetical protein